jgi:hypothetical protein
MEARPFALCIAGAGFRACTLLSHLLQGPNAYRQADALRSMSHASNCELRVGPPGLSPLDAPVVGADLLCLKHACRFPYRLSAWASLAHPSS